MMCQWNKLLGILPAWLRKSADDLGRQSLMEIRLRINAPPEFVLHNELLRLEHRVETEDLHYIVNTACQYSPWAAITQSQGYITAPGGHRIGICGDMIVKEGKSAGLRNITSVCIRIARDFPGIAREIETNSGSVIILGAPGWGKTTLLRDLSRSIAETESVAVVDERKELFPDGFQRGKRMDILTGAPKQLGVDMLLRTMGPDWIVVDEITAAMDSELIRRSVGCGVKFLASAHASSLMDFRNRPVYRALWTEGVFETALVLRKDRTFSLERIEVCH